MSAADRIISALNDAIVAEDNAAIIDAGNRLLALDSSDSDAFHAVVTAHLNESQYTEAYALLQKMPQLTAVFPFLHSYCMYRLNRFEDALAIIGSGDLDKASVALKAQCLYRCGKCAEVISLYTDLLDDPDFNRTELLTNICAAAAGAGLSRDFLKQYREELGESVDLLYNSRQLPPSPPLPVDLFSCNLGAAAPPSRLARMLWPVIFCSAPKRWVKKMNSMTTILPCTSASGRTLTSVLATKTRR